MSGLAVIFHRDRRPVEPAIIGAMINSVPHRGLDGRWARVWPEVGLGMGYAKLAVTPEDVNEQQPLPSERTGCVVMADARLDNRDELLARLPQRLPSTISDGELLLRAYEVWGTDLPRYLLGDFALIVWDPRREQLLLARDATGQRPLFYRDTGRLFAAASEVHQLLQDVDVPVVPNDNRIRDYLTPVNVFRNTKEQEETFYAGVYTVPAGQSVVVTRDGARRSTFWTLDSRSEIRYKREEDYAEHFRDVFLEAVKSRLRTKDPVAATLSGGLDSSSVVSAAQTLYRTGEVTDRGFASFSMVFDGLECDERPLIEHTRAKYGFRAHYIQASQSPSLIDFRPRYFAEEPGAFSTANDSFIEAIYQHGARVLLTGDLADAYVGGSRLVFDSRMRQGHWAALWREFRTYRRLADESLARTLVMSCLAPMLPLAIQRRITMANAERYIRGHWDELVPSWLDPNIQQDLRHRHLTLSIDMERNRRFSSPAREEAYLGLYPPFVSRDCTGWPIQSWRPYADRRLHEFMLAVPPEQHFQPHPTSDQYYAGSKRLVREGLRGILAEPIRTLANKTGFSSAFFSSLGESWAECEATFGPSARPLVVEHGYVDHERFWNRLSELRQGVRGADFIYMVRLIGLEVWLRGFSQSRAQLVSVPAPWRMQSLTRGSTPVAKVAVGVP